MNGAMTPFTNMQTYTHLHLRIPLLEPLVLVILSRNKMMKIMGFSYFTKFTIHFRNGMKKT